MVYLHPCFAEYLEVLPPFTPTRSGWSSWLRQRQPGKVAHAPQPQNFWNVRKNAPPQERQGPSLAVPPRQSQKSMCIGDRLWREADGRTVPAAHDDLLDQLAIRHVESPIKKGLLFLLPMEIEHPPQKLLEQVAVRNTTLDSDSDRQSVETGTRERDLFCVCFVSRFGT